MPELPGPSFSYRQDPRVPAFDNSRALFVSTGMRPVFAKRGVPDARVGGPTLAGAAAARERAVEVLEHGRAAGEPLLVLLGAVTDASDQRPNALRLRPPRTSRPSGRARTYQRLKCPDGSTLRLRCIFRFGLSRRRFAAWALAWSRRHNKATRPRALPRRKNGLLARSKPIRAGLRHAEALLRLAATGARTALSSVGQARNASPEAKCPSIWPTWR